MPSIIVERHYAIAGEKNTKNMPGVLEEISKVKYEQMISMIERFGKGANERYLGSVTDETAYYLFQGSNVFLKNGLAQPGMAKTADNREFGFKMTRLFANSPEEMNTLEKVCGLR